MASVGLVVKALAVNSRGEILTMHRSKHDEHAPGRIDLPGGGVDPGESFETAIQRELFEEAGLRVKVPDLQLVYSFTKYDGKDDEAVIRLMYVTRVGDQQVQLSHEHDSYAWHTTKEISDLFKDISWGEAIKFALDHQLPNVHLA